MNREQAKALVEKYNRGLATKEEKVWLENWYLQKSAYLFLEDHEIDFNKIEAELKSRIFNYAGLEVQIQQTKHRSLWLRIAAAAALLGIVSGLYFYHQHTTVKKIQQSELVQDVAPGGNKAILTLANGKTITLSDAKTGVIIDASSLKYNDNTAIIPNTGPLAQASGSDLLSPHAVAMSLQTPRGGTYQLRLVDGTKVWLNADSKLEFASNFGENRQRIIKLNGEAYFEVVKDKHHPFIVRSGVQEVEVLGTHFNVNAYTDEKAIKTTLLEGSVRLHTTGQGTTANRVLKPGEQATFAGNKISVAQADTESVMGWKEGLFIFHDADVPTVMRQLSRWYDIEVEYSGAIPKDLFTGGISRESNLSTVLKMLELIKIKTKIVQTETGRKLIVNP
ncbi:hypothetical protein HDC92_004975 [Pedobacter sp. AK017]|uniref:FecR family protein n=1 Tax=Pedobacter sp. AK017 TaxID=2723073 RepID=UPI00161DE432|nr:FecR family protein [Pedobacter sp. AK017]MBB5441268.1 hypothetical protein [Pedobacter sp. AK017]